jgi:hypothetical protein
MKLMSTWHHLFVALLLVGCAETQRRSDARVLASWSGPPPHVKIELVGQSASDDNQRRCDQQISNAGAVVDSDATVRAILLLQSGHNVMQVVSRNLGTVRNETVPGSSIDEICITALRAVAAELHDESEPRASVMPREGASPPGYAPVNPDVANAPGTDPAGRASNQVQSGPLPVH